MYVCLCNGVTERDIRQAAAAGCRGLPELTMRTGCGANCGSCLPMACALLAQVHDGTDPQAPVPVPGCRTFAAIAHAA